jgi:hypothetical protein
MLLLKNSIAMIGIVRLTEEVRKEPGQLKRIITPREQISMDNLKLQ